MKKALVYSILVIFLFNTTGYYFLFEVSKHLAQNEMQTMIQRNPSKIVILTIDDVKNDKEFQRIDKKEFRYRGSMYDIVREVNTGYSTVFLCLHDHKESKLFAGLKRINHSSIQLSIWDYLNMLVFSEPAITLNPSCSCDLRYPIIEISLNSTMLPNWSPPPELS